MIAPTLANTETLTEKRAVKWEDADILHEFPDGWKILYLKNAEDLKTAGRIMVHCSGERYHQFWALEVKLTYFFLLVDEVGYPQSMVHAKHAPWVGKEHPREAEGIKLSEYGRRSIAYDGITLRQMGENVVPFETAYRCPLPNHGNIPPGVDAPVWSNYVKAHKALSDNYKRNVPGIKVVGRRLKFDGKHLVILSAQGRHGSEIATHRKRIGEWLIALSKKQKEHSVA